MLARFLGESSTSQQHVGPKGAAEKKIAREKFALKHVINVTFFKTIFASALSQKFSFVQNLSLRPVNFAENKFIISWLNSKI